MGGSGQVILFIRTEQASTLCFQQSTETEAVHDHVLGQDDQVGNSLCSLISAPQWHRIPDTCNWLSVALTLSVSSAFMLSIP